MDTNLKIEKPLTEDEARAKYTKALTAFNAKCATIEALRQELEEESVELTSLKGKVDQYSNAFLRAVERRALEHKGDMPEAYEKADAIAEAKDKSESRTIGKIMGRTEDVAALEAVKEHGPSQEAIEVLKEAGFKDAAHDDAKDAIMFAASGTRPEIVPDAPAYAAQEVSEADRDETAIAAEDDETELAAPSPGQRRAENISNVEKLSPEREAQAEDVLKTVDSILSDD